MQGSDRALSERAVTHLAGRGTGAGAGRRGWGRPPALPSAAAARSPLSGRPLSPQQQPPTPARPNAAGPDPPIGPSQRPQLPLTGAARCHWLGRLAPPQWAVPQGVSPSRPVTCCSGSSPGWRRVEAEGMRRTPIGRLTPPVASGLAGPCPRGRGRDGALGGLLKGPRRGWALSPCTMAYQGFAQEYLGMPAVTRAYTTACVITTAAVVRREGPLRGRRGGKAGLPEGEAGVSERVLCQGQLGSLKGCCGGKAGVHGGWHGRGGWGP